MCVLVHGVGGKRGDATGQLQGACLLVLLPFGWLLAHRGPGRLWYATTSALWAERSVQVNLLHSELILDDAPLTLNVRNVRVEVRPNHQHDVW